MKQFHIHNRWEFFLAAILLRWEQNAPTNKHWGELDGRPACNSQAERLAYVLQKIAVGQADAVYRSLAQHTRRSDGNSYVSKNTSWMDNPMPLWDGWYVEGCQNIGQKHAVLDDLVRVGYSPEFVECARTFVEGGSIEGYLPTFPELKAMFKDTPGCTFTDRPPGA